MSHKNSLSFDSGNNIDKLKFGFYLLPPFFFHHTWLSVQEPYLAVLKGPYAVRNVNQCQNCSCMLGKFFNVFCRLRRYNQSSA